MDWFRSWHGAPTDNKWLPIAKRAGVTPMMVSATFWALLDYASQQEERGSIEGFDVETYAMWAGCEEAEVNAILDAMRAKGVITDGETLAAWDKRQPKREDESYDRVRRFRDKQRQSVTNGAVTQCNASVTQCNAPEKIREDTEQSREDSDTDKNRPEKEPEPPAQPARSFARAFTDAEVKQVATYLESNGIPLTPFVIDSYMEAVQDYGIQATVAGIQAAAENGKQQKMRYVLACIRNVATGSNGNGNGKAPLAALASVQLPPELAAMMGA